MPRCAPGMNPTRGHGPPNVSPSVPSPVLLGRAPSQRRGKMSRCVQILVTTKEILVTSQQILGCTQGFLRCTQGFLGCTHGILVHANGFCLKPRGAYARRELSRSASGGSWLHDRPRRAVSSRYKSSEVFFSSPWACRACVTSACVGALMHAGSVASGSPVSAKA